MSLYNLMFGKNKAGGAILATLGLTENDTGRFRDCFVANGEIAVYTRNGGGNREAYQDVFDALSNHPCYIRDEDDTFDNTYATIFFKFPDEFQEDLKKIDSGVEFNPSERWVTAIELLKTHN